MKTSLHNYDIQRILKKGKRIVADKLTVVYETNNDKKKRYAVLVPKRKVKKSSERNKVRRIIREAVRTSDIPLSLFVVLCTGKTYTYDGVSRSLKKITNDIID